MARIRLIVNSIIIVMLITGIIITQDITHPSTFQTASASTPSQPLVAIHISELTQALETMPANPPTPTGSGYSGYEWFHTAWHYFVMPESLKIALESDGTPYVVVTDADIAAGDLLDGGSPRYPIVFSLASEAVDDNGIQPLRDYVNAGGYLFVGSSAFTRNPDGTTRGNFALSGEMGLNMVNNTLENWAFNSSFTHLADHRLVSHIPIGTVSWDMLMNAEDVVWGSSGAQHLFQVVANGAEVIATGGGRPLLTTNGYGSGRIIYHSILNPIVGAGGYDSGMYAYTIYRNAIEWAFEAANMPIVKRSAWPYDYDAAFMVRHDFENYLSAIGGTIESSAQYEQSIGAKGDYYFCTGVLRTYTGDKQPYIDSIRRAVSNYGATIGSHNGGYPNIGVTDTGAYNYWHWGPDTMIDQTSGFPAPYDYYTDGYDYSKDSIELSYQDIEGWLAGTDNGRVGCGTTGDCPRTWVAPYFNSGRDRSFKIFEELGASVMGEQKVSPFPHWTLSYDPSNSDHRYDIVTLPPSDWYVGSNVSQSIEGHNTASIQALVDFYTQKGYLMNLYGHGSSTGGNTKTYVDYAVAKPNMWATNAVGLYDWWVKRDPVLVTPSYTKSGETAIASAIVSGSTDPQTAIELVLPNWSSGVVGNLEVLLNGTPANPSEYRTTNYGVKVRVGTAVTDVEVRFQPLEAWVQTDWSGGPGQTVWSDATRYDSATCDDSVTGQVSLNLASSGSPLFSDDFNRGAPPPPEPVPFTWITSGIPGNYGVFDTIGGTLNANSTASGQYGYAYKDVPVQPAGDYTIEADVRFPNAGSFGGGIYGRLDPASGTRYAVWIYPGSSTLRLIRFNNWSGWTGLGDYAIPSVGSGWHHIKMEFSGSNIQVFYDNGTTPTHNVNDTNYSTGYVGVDFWTTGNTYGPSYNNYVVKDNLGNELFSDNFGDDPTVPDLLSPWTVYTGAWSVTDYELISTGGGLSSYANIYYVDTAAWTDYSVQAQVQYPSGAFGGGLVGRLDPATGTRYTAWIYPGTSILRLIEWSDWDSWTALTEAAIPAVGEGWHTVKMDFSGSRIRVYWDGNLLIDADDISSPYLSGGIGFDAYSQGGAYLIAADDVEVLGPDQYESSCVLNSSAYDGGVGAEWYTLAWDAFIPGSTSACVRTRTADRADLLSAEAWSDCYPPGSGEVTSLDRRFIQYQIELETSDTIVTPVFFENLITYTPGSYLPASYLSFNAPFSGDSQTTVDLTATLMDENNAPIVGRTVSFALDGLPAVSGITDENGIASAALPLEIAPGDYLLQVSFTSDGVYGPSSTSAAFAVTESWSEWIQDSEVDFGSGTSNGVDTISIPGSVILLSQLIGEGEEGGAFSVSGAPGWTYRRRLFIDNPNTSELPAGYSIKLSLDTASLVSIGKLLENGDDLRLVYHDGETQVELHRLNDTPFNTANTEIWFKTYAPIPAGASDDNFYIYYGNPGAGAPLADPAQVWAFWDTFDGATLNTALWNPAGSITVSGGQAHLAVGADLFSNTPFTNGVLEVNLKTVGEDAYMWWGWEDGRADAPNFIVFEEYASPTNLTALVRSDGSPYTSFSIADPVGGLTTWHSYITDWAPGQARWLIDGVQMHTTTSNVPTSPMNININAVARGIDVEWVRMRLRAAQEPLVSLSSTYSVYLSPGVLHSVPFDTGQHSGWKYLVWDALTPGGTSVNLELRTASTQEGLESAEWANYAASGLLITNPDARWIQYRATLTTADPDVTPELQRVVIYYINLNQPPIVDAGVQYNGNEGSSIALGDATASDPDDDDLTYAWSVSSPQCTFSDPSVLNPTMVCDDNGGYTATLTVSDGVNDPVSSDAEVFVNNVAPMGTLNIPVEVDEGSDINLSLTGSFDPSAADTAAGFEYAFDCGDGNGYGAFSGDNSTVCPTDDNGLRTVGNKIRDKDGGETEYTAQLTVHNVAPTLSPIGVTTDLVLLGSSINASASFSDPGAADTHTVVWNWGDEQTTTVENATSPFSTEHTYAETGVYIVQLIVTDDDGGSASESYEFIVVYNPDGGYVMGNGWLWSDPGAYVADPSLEGYAMFGFVSRYRPGANVPSGRTKFVFMVGDLDFQSSSYDWLVITGSNYARFKGVGTVNGELAPNGEAYKFQIWARDDAPDTFRIKIWYEVDEVEIVVYDNTMHQPIGGGNIVISTK